MKKILLITGAIALFMASCSQEEFEQYDAAQKVEGKGVSFVASINEGAATRAAYKPYETVFNHHWYADQDKIGVFYKKGTKVKVLDDQTAEDVDGDQWVGLQVDGTKSNSFEFKATASGTQGYFVANGDNNTLWLDAPDDLAKGYSDEEKPIFRAYWPLENPKVDFAASAGNVIKISAYAAAEQIQETTDGHGIAENAFMVSESDTKSTYDANDNSVAKDRFSLSFKRVTPIVYFKILANSSVDKDLNREYERDYAENLFTSLGKLKTVELEAKGSTKNGTSLTASKLTFNNGAGWDIAADNVYDPKTAFKAGTSGATSKITTKMADNSPTGLAWSNDAVAYMTIASVDRSEYRTAGEKEKVTATYGFENVQYETSVETDKDWAFDGENAKWIGFPTQAGYNLDAQPYIVYVVNSSEFVLQINPSFEGELADLFDGNNLIGIKDGNGNAITKSNIKHFISKVNITEAADFATIKELEALTNVTLLENTTIPAKAFEGLTGLVYLNLPMVTTVENVNAFPENNYTDVYMGSFDFSDNTGINPVRVRLLKQTNLKKADISAVANLGGEFPESGVNFNGFSSLEEITVKSGIVVGGTAFNGCEKLTKVQFPKDIVGASLSLAEGANSQFMGCEALTEITISNTVIPAMAFNGCKALESINGSNGKAIVPTAIGISSFEGCEALVDMDLSKAATIGASAFKGCKALKGNDNVQKDRTVLYVNAVTHVSDNAFENCEALEFISFANATTIGVDILKGTKCKEIEFLKPFTVNSEEKTIAGTTNFFGTTNDTKLFCAKGQIGLGVVNAIKLTGNAKDSEEVSTTFGKGITQYL